MNLEDSHAAGVAKAQVDALFLQQPRTHVPIKLTFIF